MISMSATSLRPEFKGSPKLPSTIGDSVGWESGRRQTPMRMANGADAGHQYSAVLLCCEHCCQR